MPCIVPQTLYELWTVATRPAAVNGLGLSAPEATALLSQVRADFVLLPDSDRVLPAWLHLVTTLAVMGKQAHDARLVAAMQVHGLTHLLTFNDAHFRRFPGLTVLTPAGVLAGPP